MHLTTRAGFLDGTTEPTAEVIDARTYGAVPDDAGDDSAGIQRALNAAQTLMLPVYLSPGTYRVSSAIIIPASVTLQGEAATLYVTRLNSKFKLTVSTGAQLLSLTLFRESVPEFALSLPAVVAGRDATLEDVTISNFNNGIVIVGARVLLDGVNISCNPADGWKSNHSTGYGIQLGSSTKTYDLSDIVIRNTRCCSNASDGLKLFGTVKRLSILDSSFDDNGQMPDYSRNNGSGIDFYGLNNLVDGVLMERSSFSRNRGSGINIKNVPGCRFANILVADCVASENVLSGSGVCVPYYSGANYVTNVSIVGGTFDGNAASGIKVYNTQGFLAQSTRTANNRCYGMVVSGRDATLNGCYCAQNGSTLATGDSGIVIQSANGVTIRDTTILGYEPLHAASATAPSSGYETAGNGAVVAVQDNGLYVAETARNVWVTATQSLYNRTCDIRVRPGSVNVVVESDTVYGRYCAY